VDNRGTRHWCPEKTTRCRRKGGALYRDAHAGVEECFQIAEVLFDVVGLEALYGILAPGRYVFVDPLLDVVMIIPDKPRSAAR
jgi:hypothetical protein